MQKDDSSKDINNESIQIYALKGSYDFKTKDKIIEEIMKTSHISKQKANTYFNEALKNNRLSISTSNEKIIQDMQPKEVAKTIKKSIELNKDKEKSKSFDLSL